MSDTPPSYPDFILDAQSVSIRRAQEIVAEATKELREQLARTEQHFDEATTALVIFKLNTETELAKLRSGIAEAVKAAEEAKYSSGNVPSQHDVLEIADFLAGDNGALTGRQVEALDRYVASKVREAKVAAYERARDDFRAGGMLTTHTDCEKAAAYCDTLAAAERQEAGQ